jgi:glutamyl-tRNA reductase
MSICVIGLSYRSAPVTVRERFAFAEGVIPGALERLMSEGIASEAVILSTCNRVELYAASGMPEESASAALREFLIRFHRYPDPVHEEIYSHKGQSAVEHLFRVACGLDSMVLGETEILGQMKKAYDLALHHKSTGAVLNKAFQKAFNVAKQIRTETNIQRGSISVASVAVELAEKIFSTLKGHKVMVIGAGDTSEKTARALLSRGAASLVVTNRSLDRAEALAREFDGRAVPFDQWEGEFADIDIIVSSTASPVPVVTCQKLRPLLKLRRNKPLLLIDIAVPRDIEPEVNRLDGVYLYNIDDMQTIADDYLRQRKTEIAICEQIIQEKAQSLMEAQGRHQPA